MKTNIEFFKELTDLKTFFGFDPTVEQGSHEWQSMRLGVITASNAYKLLKKGRGGAPSAMRQTYMKDLIAQVCTGKYKEIDAAPLAWGRENEQGARSAYEFATGEKVNSIPFIFKDEKMRCGISPDGLIEGKEKGLELKCPFSTTTHIETILTGQAKDEYVLQCQFSMWVTDASEWVFASYDPRMLKKMLGMFSIKRDEEIMGRFDIEVGKFIREMDTVLAEIEIEWGQQWLC